ncbi:MAG TPA: hypothetical protein VMT18_01410 [Planctomycetota bacterium]|nr:hypothetical protein [Planctomycetota bacterium]
MPPPAPDAGEEALYPLSPGEERLQNFVVNFVFSLGLLLIAVVKVYLHFGPNPIQNSLAGAMGALFGHLLVWGLAYQMCWTPKGWLVLTILSIPVQLVSLFGMPLYGFVGLLVMFLVRLAYLRLGGVVRET